eukprot:TRINITY_DN36796_c1_g1_i1.p1 TRINITY_DN36796_c1_g1~~TRINITY_DN36796_c1_g1_i1.p1  ORF type:complete len:307 (+),score=58.27 TRINITY_DN36796_c1_g1_i1:65-985(+)
MPGVRSFAVPVLLAVAAQADDGFLAAQLPAANDTRGTVASQGLDVQGFGGGDRFAAFLERQSNLCLSIDNDHIRHGAKMQTWTCVFGFGQQFVYWSWDKTLRSANNPDYCVVADHNRLEPSTKAKLEKCHEAGVGKFWIAEEKHFQGSEDVFVRFLNKQAVENNYGVCLGIDKQFAGLRDWVTLASTNSETHQCFYRRVQRANQPTPKPPAPTPSPTLPPSSEQPPCPVEDCGASQSVCGSHGKVTLPCCGAMECQESSRQNVMRCVECAPEGDICGTNGQVTQTCCSGLTCQTADGRGLMVCLRN